ncbi:hypothetical protein GK047_03845 [Paenibacillus sp. SYP-B3998]|uniref:Uncharacterized protein n=1 Tax=Paenibacillus sp. SYP-B3998 TaxID=2678564 RepID=A0A6G3ZSN4_9BACL|nr:hypothetical protein [Paenibacillus sp. SYP-B3998]NEW05152.1 hypothetical protein [Paenibacillus sp. SYP-B3998]
MWKAILGQMPPGMVLIGTLLAFIIPFSINWINEELHKHGDPPWKLQPEDEQLPDHQQLHQTQNLHQNQDQNPKQKKALQNSSK